MKYIFSFLLIIPWSANAQYRQNQQQSYQNYQNQQPVRQQQQFGQQVQTLNQYQNQQQIRPQQNSLSGTNQQFQNGQQSYSRASVNTNPIRMTNSSDYGATMTLTLRSYSNPSNSLDSTTTCACPVITCSFLKSTEQNNCQFSFMVVVSSADQTVKMIQSDFYPFSQSISQGNWTQPITLQLPTKPSAIDIFVQHLGAVIQTSNAQLLYFDNRLTLVDAFAIPLLSVDPTSGNARFTQTLVSQLQSTSSLSVDLSLQCQQNYMGKNCDLLCGTLSTPNGNSVLCKSSLDGAVQSCQYNAAKTQVSSCATCTNYNTTSNLCTYGTGETHTATTSRAFRTWTIVLGVLLGLALLLILCLIIAYIILRNREREEEYDNAPAVYKPPPQNNSTYTNGNTRNNDEWPSTARRPLLNGDTGQSEDVYRTTTVTTTQRQEHAV